jgi:hypothetical protein
VTSFSNPPHLGLSRLDFDRKRIDENMAQLVPADNDRQIYYLRPGKMRGHFRERGITNSPLDGGLRGERYHCALYL